MATCSRCRKEPAVYKLWTVVVGMDCLDALIKKGLPIVKTVRLLPRERKRLLGKNS